MLLHKSQVVVVPVEVSVNEEGLDQVAGRRTAVDRLVLGVFEVVDWDLVVREVVSID